MPQSFLRTFKSVGSYAAIYSISNLLNFSSASIAVPGAFASRPWAWNRTIELGQLHLVAFSLATQGSSGTKFLRRGLATPLPEAPAEGIEGDLHPASAGWSVEEFEGRHSTLVKKKEMQHANRASMSDTDLRVE